MSVTRSSPSPSSPSRRDFLNLATSGLVGLSGLLAAAGLFRFLDFEGDPVPQTAFDLGPVSDFPMGSRSSAPGIPAIVIHSQDGFSALSLTCTHLGCTVEDSGNGFSCPRHGSRYDGRGNVLRGPATRALRQFRVETTADEHLVVHTD